MSNCEDPFQSEINILTNADSRVIFGSTICTAVISVVFFIDQVNHCTLENKIIVFY